MPQYFCTFQRFHWNTCTEPDCESDVPFLQTLMGSCLQQKVGITSSSDYGTFFKNILSVPPKTTWQAFSCSQLLVICTAVVEEQCFGSEADSTNKPLVMLSVYAFILPSISTQREIFPAQTKGVSAYVCVKETSRSTVFKATKWCRWWTVGGEAGRIAGTCLWRSWFSLGA